MKPLTIESLNPSILKVQYAVRGELAIKAEEFRDKIRLSTEDAHHGLPFDKVVSSNIGNPQQKGLDQSPLTFVRQVSLSPILFYFIILFNNNNNNNNNKTLGSGSYRVASISSISTNRFSKRCY